MLILHRFKWSINNTPFGELSFATVLFRLGKDKPEVSSALGFFCAARDRGRQSLSAGNADLQMRKGGVVNAET